MLVLSTLIDIEVVQQTASKGTFRQHALHGVTQDALHSERLLAKLGRRVETLSAGIAGITGVDLVGLFLASELHLCSVDDDNIVTAIDVRSETGLVLAADKLGDLRGEKDSYKVKDVKLTKPDGSKFDMKRKYQLVTNSYVASIADSPRKDQGQRINRLTADLIINYLERQPSVSYQGVSRVVNARRE